MDLVGNDMKIFQLVYTKVPPEESPQKEADFHTVFYSKSLLSKQDVYEIEKRIYFPGGEFISKETVFYQNLQGKDYLVILHIRNLPEAIDTFGRAGIFICHGFIYPPELWKLSPQPMKLFELVKDKIFARREDALCSILVDKKTGDIKPIEILEASLNVLSQNLPKLSLELEQKLLIALFRIANTKGSPKILIKGLPEAISHLMNKLFAYIPDDIKAKLGWDAALDGGSLTYCPLNIIGYKYRPPVGAATLKVDLEAQAIEESNAEFLLPNSPIERWLYFCRNEISSKKDIEAAFSISLLIEDKREAPLIEKFHQPQRGFIEVNKENIKDAFIRKCKEYLLPQEILKYISKIITPDRMLSLIIENIPMEKLADYIEKVIISNKLKIKESLPQSIIDKGGIKLKLIDKVYRGEDLTMSEMMNLRQEDKTQLIKYFIITNFLDKKLLIDIIKQDKKLFSELFLSCQKDMQELLCKSIPKEFKKIESLLLNKILKEEKAFSLLKGEIDFMEILESLLKEESLSEEDMKMLIFWANKKKSKSIESRYIYIKTFLYPKEGIPELFLKDNNLKRILFPWLILHGYKSKDLQELGFYEPFYEIEKKGLFEQLKKRVKALFGGDKKDEWPKIFKD